MYRDVWVDFGDKQKVKFVFSHSKNELRNKLGALKTDSNKKVNLSGKYLADFENRKLNNLRELIVGISDFYDGRFIYNFKNEIDKSDFDICVPIKEEYQILRKEPERSDAEFNIEPGLFKKLFLKKYFKHIDEMDRKFLSSIEEYKLEKIDNRKFNDEINDKFNLRMIKWHKDKEDFLLNQKKRNSEILKEHKEIKLCNGESSKDFMTL